MNLKHGDKVIFSQEYLESVREIVSDRYYDAISKTLVFNCFYPNDSSFSIVKVGGVSVVAPTSSLIHFRSFDL